MRISKAQTEAVKQANDIVSIIQSRGIKLKKKGKNYVGLCPFHVETTPSFTVDPVKQLYHCFGCKSNGSGSTGGDVIGFLVKFDKVTFKKAVETLGNGNGSGIVKQKSGASSQETEEKKPATRNSQHVTRNAKQQKLLNRTIEYYQAELSRDIKGINYLQKQRGIQDKQSILDFGAGFASGNLLQVIPSDGEVIDNLKAIGILNNKGNEFFYGSVLFPLLDDNNNVVSVYARRIGDGNVKHLYLPGKKQGIINRQAAKRSKSLIITESVIDALSLYDAGFKNVIPCYGVNGLTDDHLFLFSRNGTKEVYICFDADDAGKSAAESVSGQLKEKNITAYTINLPEKDANDYFKTHSPKQFEELLKQANPNSAQRSQHVVDREETFYQKTNHGFIIVYKNRQYEIKGIARQGTQLKATIQANNTNSRQASLFELSTIDMYSSRSREYFAALCSRFFNESEELIKEDLNRLLERMEQYIDNHNSGAKKQQPQEITQEEKDAAMRFLTSPNLFDEILSDLEITGCTGEDTNKLLCYIAAVSRKLDNPVSILIQSRSAAGKTTLQNAILSLIPEEDYICYTRITDQALFYKKEDSLVHKILAIEEAEGMGGVAYSIRNIQSSKSLTIACTGKDPATGRQQTEEHIVKGPVMVLITTTSPDIDEETSSLFICISIDETEKMTERIHKIQRESETLQGLLNKTKGDQITKKHHNAQRLLQPIPVVNPYSPYLTFPTHSLRSRRDHKKYLSLIKAVTFIHQYQRKKKTVTHDNQTITYIEVTLKDIEQANRIANEVLGQTLDDLTAPARKLLFFIRKMVEETCKKEKTESSDYTFSRRHVREYTGWSDWQIRTHLKELTDMEYIRSRQGSWGKEYSYHIGFSGDLDKKHYLGLTTVSDIRKLLRGKKPDSEGKKGNSEGTL